MTDANIPRLDVAAALFLDKDLRLLWTWNPRWCTFALPLTKLRPGESPRQAAERAAAEALGTPSQAGVRLPPRADVYVSGRDHTLKLYRYHVCRVEAHPRYAAAASPVGPHVWLTAADALSGDYRPLSAPCLELIGQLVAEGLLPGRSQMTSTLVVVRGPEDDRRYLLRWNDSWGYALPAKRRGAGDDVLATARRVAAEELGLEVPAALRLTPARPSTVTLRDESASVEAPTFYVHSLFRAEPADGARPRSSAPLVWVTVAEVVNGATDAQQAEPGGGAAKPGPVSRTVRTILEALGEF